ncbi:MAG: arginine--tRNA ligase [bacterium]|nr:arginine--tRNA ligase [bacterium]
MYAFQQAQKQVIAGLKRHLGKAYTPHLSELEKPPKPEMGDIAFPVFGLAKGEKRNPIELARELAAKIGPSGMISKIDAAGPYVNFYLDPVAYRSAVLDDIASAKEAYGCNTTGEKKKIVLEYAQPNTHKDFHIGHVRNAVLGESLVRVLRANGFEVVSASYIGDIGAHVAKAIWGIQKTGGIGAAPELGKAAWLQEQYASSSHALKEDASLKPEIDAIQERLEAREEPETGLWTTTRQWSIDAFKAIFAELHVKPDSWYFESEVEQPGKKMVQKLLTDGIARKSDGAVIVDLEEEGLDVFLILKSDGSSLYATKDLALAVKKDADHAPDRQLFVVDVRQSHYFKQLFATLKRMGFSQPMTHISYDMVTLPDGAMSSRSGNIITYASLRDEMVSVLTAETKKRHEDWDDKKAEAVAKKIAIASMQFMMLRQDPQSMITFDMKEALSFDGFSAPYILYSLARMERLQEKAGMKPKRNDALLQKEMLPLIHHLGIFPEVIARAGRTYQVSAIATWVFEAAQLFSEYYHSVRILEEGDKAGVQARLSFIHSVKTSMEYGLSLLAIEPVNEM